MCNPQQPAGLGGPCSPSGSCAFGDCFTQSPVAGFSPSGVDGAKTPSRSISKALSASPCQQSPSALNCGGSVRDSNSPGAHGNSTPTIRPRRLAPRKLLPRGLMETEVMATAGGPRSKSPFVFQQDVPKPSIEEPFVGVMGGAYRGGDGTLYSSKAEHDRAMYAKLAGPSLKRSRSASTPPAQQGTLEGCIASPLEKKRRKEMIEEQVSIHAVEVAATDYVNQMEGIDADTESLFQNSLMDSSQEQQFVWSLVQEYTQSIQVQKKPLALEESQFHGFEESQFQGFEESEIQEFEQLAVQGFEEPQFQRFEESEFQWFEEFEIDNMVQ